MYVGSTNVILKKLQKLGYTIIAYADDWVLIVDKGKSLEALQNATKIFAEYGLEIS